MFLNLLSGFWIIFLGGANEEESVKDCMEHELKGLRASFAPYSNAETGRVRMNKHEFTKALTAANLDAVLPIERCAFLVSLTLLV